MRHRSLLRFVLFSHTDRASKYVFPRNSSSLVNLTELPLPTIAFEFLKGIASYRQLPHGSRTWSK